MACGNDLSVASVTISTTTTEEDKMEPNVASQILEVISAKDTEIEILNNHLKHLEYSNENLNASVNKYYAKEQQLRSYLMDNYESLELHTEEIANIFDIPLTKEIEFEATMIVSGTVEVPLFDEFDIEEFLSENIYVDSANGEICISDHSVDHVREA